MQSPKSRRPKAPGESPSSDGNPTEKSGGSRPGRHGSDQARSKAAQAMLGACRAATRRFPHMLLLPLRLGAPGTGILGRVTDVEVPEPSRE